MAFNVTEFAAAGLPQGGARPSLFQVTIETPNGIPNVASRIAYTCEATAIPGSTMGVIPLRYFGREIKIAGTRTFAPWNATILNDEDFSVRNAMEQWSNAINRHQANLQSPGISGPAQYRTTATIKQYGKTGGILRTYELVNCWPSDISVIDLNWATGDDVERFQLTLEYDYWRIVTPTTTGTLAV